MADIRIRQQIALLAARLMYERTESEYFTAKRKAARQLGVEGRFRPKDLPSNAEIREQILSLAQLYEGEGRRDNLREMRLAALRMMRLLSAFYPRLIGSVLTGHIRQGSDVDLHVFSDNASAVTSALDDAQLRYALERKRVIKLGEERVFTHIHLTSAGYNFELTLYETAKINYGFKSSITGRLIERATLAELMVLLGHEYPDVDLSEEAQMYAGAAGEDVDVGARFAVFQGLLTPLENVKQDARFHPEGDALYHSLQVFELAKEAAAYDEEFLLAALLHDVGKGIDKGDHVAAGLEALEGYVSERTAFLIAHHMDAHLLVEGTLGHRAAVRLRASEHFDDLMLLQDLDRKGRRPGAQVSTLAQALGFVRHLAEENERWE